jgi:hypothetical protein
MAWTTPRTWVTDETLTAANLNTHVRDNLNALYGTDSTYTPTLTQSATISKTVNEARYIQTGRIVEVWVVLSPTSSGTASNALILGLPVAASGHLSSALVGDGYIYDGSGANVTYHGHWRLTSTTTVNFTSHGSAPATGAFGISPAVTIASGDAILAHLRYVVA